MLGPIGRGLPLSWQLGQEKNFQTCKDSYVICLNKLKYEKICNPSLIYTDDLNSSSFLSKITS